MKVSIYSKYNSVTPSKTVSIYKALETIRDGTYKEQINNVRLLIEDKPKRDLEKRKLPLIGFGGTFSSRGNNNLIKSSGFAMLDFDHVTDLSSVTDEINKDNYTFSSFISPSGDGLKVLVKIPLVESDSQYKTFYIKLQEYYSKYYITDESTKDISRATYVSYDSDLYLNLESKLFADRFIREPIKSTVMPDSLALTDNDKVASRLITWFKKKWTTGQNRNNNLFMLSSAFNDYGVEKHIALDYCLNYVSKDFNEVEIQSLVNSAYKNTSNFGTKFFEDKKKMNAIKKMVFVGATKEQIKNKIGDEKGIENIISEIQKNTPEDIFWDVDDNGKIHISFFRFDRYLKNKGISKYFQDTDSASYEFITKDVNFLNWIDSNRIKDIVKKDLIEKGHIDVWDLMASNTRYFSREYLSMLDTTDVNYKRDTKKESFLYFKNFAVRTTKKNIELLPYEDIKDLIWRKQVIDRDIDIKGESDGIFKTFIWKVSGEDVDRYYTLKSVIGYLLHSYQNDSKPKAIIFNDILNPIGIYPV